MHFLVKETFTICFIDFVMCGVDIHLVMSAQYNMDLNVPKRWQRKNGWQRPLTPRQIILLVTFVFGAVAGFGIFLPVIPGLFQTVGYVCLTVLYIWGFISYVLAVSINPSSGGKQNSMWNPVKCVWDSKTRCCRVGRHESDRGINFFCNTCNKLVEHHDHHCEWLNTCIGGRNYRFFVNTIVSGFLIALQISVMAWYIISVCYIQPRLRGAGTIAEISTTILTARGESFPILPGELSAIVILVIATVSAAIYTLVFAFLGFLITFHIYLYCIGMSTSECIFAGREMTMHDEDNYDVEAGESELSDTDFETILDNSQANTQGIEP
uniref:Palmitoyltransferase n=1 Tax=Leptobrachium leishanense TaxID=445787 RepID=A0A8C5QGW7_9ANUR